MVTGNSDSRAPCRIPESWHFCKESQAVALPTCLTVEYCLEHFPGPSPASASFRKCEPWAAFSYKWEGKWVKESWIRERFAGTTSLVGGTEGTWLLNSPGIAWAFLPSHVPFCFPPGETTASPWPAHRSLKQRSYFIVRGLAPGVFPSPGLFLTKWSLSCFSGVRYELYFIVIPNRTTGQTNY